MLSFQNLRRKPLKSPGTWPWGVMGCLEILLDADATVRELHLIFSGCEGYQKATAAWRFASENLDPFRETLIAMKITILKR